MASSEKGGGWRLLYYFLAGGRGWNACLSFTIVSPPCLCVATANMFTIPAISFGGGNNVGWLPTCSFYSAHLIKTLDVCDGCGGGRGGMQKKKGVRGFGLLSRNSRDHKVP